MWERLIRDLIEVWFWSNVSKKAERSGQAQLSLPSPDALTAAFSIPPRGHYELNATQHQKRKLELMGATNYALIDSLGREQAKYLIEFHEVLKLSREQEFARLRAQQQRDDELSQRNTVAAIILTVLLSGILAFFIVAHSSRINHEAVSSEPSPSLITLPSPTPESPHGLFAPTPTVAPPVTSTPFDFPKAVAASQRAAVAKYPALGVAGSRMNQEFLSRHVLWRQAADKRLLRPDWPERLADECAASR